MMGVTLRVHVRIGCGYSPTHNCEHEQRCSLDGARQRNDGDACKCRQRADPDPRSHPFAHYCVSEYEREKRGSAEEHGDETRVESRLGDVYQDVIESEEQRREHDDDFPGKRSRRWYFM